MVSEERTQELISGLQEAVLGFDEEAAVELSKAVLEEGVDPYYAIRQGLAVGMGDISERIVCYTNPPSSTLSTLRVLFP